MVLVVTSKKSLSIQTPWMITNHAASSGTYLNQGFVLTFLLEASTVVVFN